MEGKGFIEDKAEGRIEQCQETHAMRYLFKPEIEGLAERAGICVVESAAWLTNRTPSYNACTAHFVCCL